MIPAPKLKLLASLGLQTMFQAQTHLRSEHVCQTQMCERQIKGG